MTKQSKTSNNKHSADTSSPKTKQSNQPVKQPVKQSQQPSRQAASQQSKRSLISAAAQNQAGPQRASAGKSLKSVDNDSRASKANKAAASKQARNTNGAADGAKKSQPKSPKTKDGSVSDKWSGSTFHSSPNAASLPRPPFGRTTPPLAAQSLNQSPALPPPVEQLQLASASRRPAQQMPFQQQMQPQIGAQLLPHQPVGFAQAPSPFMHMSGPYGSMYPPPMFSGNGMPSHYMGPGMPVGLGNPQFGMNNHPTALNPMFMGPPAMVMPQSSKAEN